jgi:DNA-binding MarR family transcriptional regulator
VIGKVACHCTRLRRAARTVTRLYDEKLAAAGVTATQYSLLRAINRAQRPSLTDLGAVLDLERSTLGRNIHALEKTGMVRMRWGEDRRERAISLTAKGRAAMNKGVPLWLEAQAEIEQALGSELLEQMARVAQKLEAFQSR